MSTAMARPTKHDDNTREALLDAAEALLAAHGPNAVSVRSVADRVGVSTRAVYSVFGSKPGLMGALATRGFHRLADLVNGLPITNDPLADLAAAGPHAFRVFALERPHLFRITFDRISEEIYSQPETYPALFASFSALESRFTRALSTGLLAKRPMVEWVFMYHSFCCGLAANELSILPPPVGANFWKVAKGIDFEALWECALAAFVRGLGFISTPEKGSRSTH
jgi:AcrR family transcriptional regulator